MSDIEAVEMLTQAKERLFEHGWGRGVPDSICDGLRNASYRDPDGTLCLEEACVGHVGAYLNTARGVQCRVHSYLRASVSTEYPMYWWNDEQESAGPVFDAIDRAIEIAKEAPNPATA